MFSLLIKNKYSTLIVNEFNESYSLNYKYWNKFDYQRSWMTSLSMILNNKKTSAAFITDMNYYRSKGSLCAWILHRRGVRIIISQKIFSDKIGKIEFNEYGSIIIKDSLSGKFSKWECTLDDVTEYSQRKSFII